MLDQCNVSAVARCAGPALTISHGGRGPCECCICCIMFCNTVEASPLYAAAAHPRTDLFEVGEGAQLTAAAHPPAF
jgi:hypothetical protein